MCASSTFISKCSVILITPDDIDDHKPLEYKALDNFIVNTLGSLAVYVFFPKKTTIAVQRTVDRQLTLF